MEMIISLLRLCGSKDPPLHSAQNKKAHSLRVGRVPLNFTLCSDDGPSLLCGAMRKSPVIRVGREIHGSQFTESREKRKVELVMEAIS
jgi:hypothetical protein